MSSCNQCKKSSASCIPECGSIGKLFGHQVTDTCENLKISPTSDVSVSWCGNVATFEIVPCNLLLKNIVRGADCITTEVVKDPLTGDCYVEVGDSKKYFVNGVLFQPNYNGNECYNNLSLISSDNTVTVGQYNLGGGNLAVDLKVSSRPQSAIYRDGNGNECQVDTGGPINFTLIDPCYEMECSVNNDGVTYRNISDLGINDVAFACGRIFMSDPDDVITFTVNPSNPQEIFVQLNPGSIGLQDLSISCQTLTIEGGNSVTLPGALSITAADAHNFAYILDQVNVGVYQTDLVVANIVLTCQKRILISFLADTGKFNGGVPFPSSPTNYNTGTWRFDLFVDNVLVQQGKQTFDFGSYKTYPVDVYDVVVASGAHAISIRPVLAAADPAPPAGVDDRIDESTIVLYYFNN